MKDIIQSEVTTRSHVWVLPFAILCVTLIGFSVFAYTKYTHLTKTHIL